MLIATTIYIVGFFLALLFLCYEEIHECDFTNPLLAFGIIASVFWPVFLLMVVFEAIELRIKREKKYE